MPFPVRWLNEQKTVIQIDITDPPSWQAFVVAAEEAAAMARSVPHSVSLIVHPHQLPMPRGERPLPYLQRALNALPGSVAQVLVIMNRDAHLFEKTVTNIFARIALRKNVRVVGSEAEAEKLTASLLQQSPETESTRRS
jgi:hypothetical protein